MKSLRRIRNARKARTTKKRYQRTQRGGESHLGPAAGLDGTIHRFAKYWWNTMRRQVWWSDGQDGYYFSNLQNEYMSQTHTHIYKIEDLDGNPNGQKRIYFATKVNNKQTSRGTVDLPYTGIASWLLSLNQSLTGSVPKSASEKPPANASASGKGV